MTLHRWSKYLVPSVRWLHISVSSFPEIQHHCSSGSSVAVQSRDISHMKQWIRASSSRVEHTHARTHRAHTHTHTGIILTYFQMPQQKLGDKKHRGDKRLWGWRGIWRNVSFESHAHFSLAGSCRIECSVCVWFLCRTEHDPLLPLW